MSSITAADWMPFANISVISMVAFGTLAVTFRVTLKHAWTPSSRLSFMFRGAAVVVVSITLVCTLAVSWLVERNIVLEDDHG